MIMKNMPPSCHGESSKMLLACFFFVLHIQCICPVKTENSPVVSIPFCQVLLLILYISEHCFYFISQLVPVSIFSMYEGSLPNRSAFFFYTLERVVLLPPVPLNVQVHLYCQIQTGMKSYNKARVCNLIH